MILTAAAAGLASGMAIAAQAAIPMFLIRIVMDFVVIALADLAIWLPENMRQRANP